MSSSGTLLVDWIPKNVFDAEKKRAEMVEFGSNCSEETYKKMIHNEINFATTAIIDTARDLSSKNWLDKFSKDSDRMKKSKKNGIKSRFRFRLRKRKRKRKQDPKPKPKISKLKKRSNSLNYQEMERLIKERDRRKLLLNQLEYKKYKKKAICASKNWLKEMSPEEKRTRSDSFYLRQLKEITEKWSVIDNNIKDLEKVKLPSKEAKQNLENIEQEFFKVSDSILSEELRADNKTPSPKNNRRYSNEFDKLKKLVVLRKMNK